jgi:hypothetical protein
MPQQKGPYTTSQNKNNCKKIIRFGEYNISSIKK